MNNDRPIGPLTEIRDSNRRGTFRRLLEGEWELDDYFSVQNGAEHSMRHAIVAGDFHEAVAQAWIHEARKRGVDEWLNRPLEH